MVEQLSLSCIQRLETPCSRSMWVPFQRSYTMHFGSFFDFVFQNTPCSPSHVSVTWCLLQLVFWEDQTALRWEVNYVTSSCVTSTILHNSSASFPLDSVHVDTFVVCKLVKCFNATIMASTWPVD